MKRFFAHLIIFISLLSTPAWAQVKPDEGQLLVPPPMIEPANPDGSRCFTVVNKAPYTVNGSVVSNYFTNLAGQKGRNISNFRLPPGEEKKYCTLGPYYPGTRIGFVIRTIMPIFSCYTVAQGEIEILGEYKQDGKTRTWVNCQ